MIDKSNVPDAEDCATASILTRRSRPTYIQHPLACRLGQGFWLGSSRNAHGLHGLAAARIVTLMAPNVYDSRKFIGISAEWCYDCGPHVLCTLMPRLYGHYRGSQALAFHGA